MKKIKLVAALSAALVLAFGSVASAAETGKMYAGSLPGVIQVGGEWTESNGGVAGLGEMNRQGANWTGGAKGESNADYGVVGLGPASVEQAADAKIDFAVDVREAGTYKVKLCYMAKAKDGQTRCADVIVNGGERKHLDIVGQAEWNIPAYTTFEVELTQGRNHIVFVNVEGFDNSKLKAINIDYIEWSLKGDEAEEPTTAAPTEAPTTEAPTEAPTTAAPTTQAPTTAQNDADQNGGSNLIPIIIAVAAVVVVAVVVVVAKSKKKNA